MLEQGDDAMTVTITLPDHIETQLRCRAQAQQRSVEELILDILNRILDGDMTIPTPEEVVNKIRTSVPNPHNLRPAQGSLAEALRDAPTDPDFDLNQNSQHWDTDDVGSSRFSVPSAT
jgi:plasmid stability protein